MKSPTCRSARYILLLAAATIAASASFTAARAQAGASEKEQKLIAILQSDAAPAEKAIPCKQLAVCGTAACVPALAPLLANPELASWARIALEAIPDPAADAALREAVGRLQGRLLIGTINSIGVRGDAQAVPALVARLADADAGVASAAAVALGKIGSEPAAAALVPMLKTAPAAVRPSVAAGCILCAERRMAAGRHPDAVALYAAVREANVSRQKTLESIRGLILARQSDGLPLLAEMLRSADKSQFGLALRVAREVPGPAVAGLLAAELKRAAGDRQGHLLLAMAERGDREALPVALDLARAGAPESRLKAIGILDKLGDASSVGVLLGIAGEGDGEPAAASRSVLARLPGKETDAALGALLRDPKPATRCMAIELLAQRQVEGLVPTLLKTAQDDGEESVRLAALKSLRSLAGLGELRGLLDLLVRARSAEETRAAEAAATTVCMRSAKVETGSVEILKALYGDLPDGRFLDVTRQVRAIVKGGSLEIAASNGNFGDSAGGIVKSLKIDYRVGGRTASRTVRENETLDLSTRSVPPECVAEVLAALPKAPLQPKLALLRMLRAFGGTAALEAIRATAASAEGEVRETALRALFDWPDADAIPDLAQLARSAPAPVHRALALRGCLRLIREQQAPAAQKLAALKDAASLAAGEEETKLVLAALGTIPTAEAFALVAPHLDQPGVRDEAAAAALGIAEKMPPPRPADVTAAVEKIEKTAAGEQIRTWARQVLGR